MYEVVRLIPRGKVMSYGGVARLCGSPHSARYVGFALHALLPDSDIPWWRVVNAWGRISNTYLPEEQRQRLEAEGVVVGDDWRIDMRLFDAESVVAEELARQRSLR
ncbi:MAG: MGMT family protein [Anaerolineae bacterium]|nr:MGMT family protein [Anaerolineae bacterium]